jgi:membrane-associated phospholipid phosphatase
MAEYSLERKPAYDFQRAVLAIQMIMIAVMCFLIINRGVVPGLDMVGLILLTVFLWLMRDRIAFLDFAPFLLMLFTYEVIRSVILAVGTDGVHVTDIIAWERTLCAGIVPAALLQQAWGAKPYTWLIDLVTNAFYMTHFFSAIFVGLILWIGRKAHYWTYLLGLTILSYATFLTYVFFPAAPPWWASMHGYLRGQPIDLSHSLLSPEYIFATANPLGAMPSLHTGYPFFLFFYCLYVWGRKALPVVVLPLGVAVSSIYLGHHYLVDVLAGTLYAAVVFVLVTRWGKSKREARERVSSLATV